MRNHSIIFLAAIAGLTFAVSDAAADCVDPVGESVTLHTYPDEAIICIGEPTEYCEECQAGFEHICRHDRWAPLRTRACDASPEPLSTAATTGFTRASDGGAPDRSAARRFFDALQSCRYMGYEEETYSSFMAEVADEGLQNAPMSEFKRIIRDVHEAELVREIRQAERERASAPADDRDYYDRAIRQLNEERERMQCVLRTAGD